MGDTVEMIVSPLLLTQPVQTCGLTLNEMEYAMC